MNRALVLLLLAALIGCGSDDEKPRPNRDDPAVFVADDAPGGATVILREAHLDAAVLELEIVQQPVAPVYGLAFRIETTPGVLGLAELAPSAAWPDALTHAVEPQPGLIVGVISRRGDEPPAEGDVLGSIRLQRNVQADSPVRFVASRSRLFDPAAQPLSEVTFVGGELQAP